MEVRELNTQRFHEFLLDEIGVPIEIKITANRRSMITFRWSYSRLSIRIHQMFLQAPIEVWQALARFCRRPSTENRKIIDQYIDQHRRHYAKIGQKTRMIVLETAGEHYDLAEVFDQINRKHFKRQCDAKITWGKERQSARKRRSGIQLGSYDPETNLIRINRALDHSWVPRYVLDSMLYHEMLHWLFRPRNAGARRVVHSKAFREAEQAHPSYQRAKTWVTQNLDRLLRS